MSRAEFTAEGALARAQGNIELAVAAESFRVGARLRLRSLARATFLASDRVRRYCSCRAARMSDRLSPRLSA